MVIFYKFPSEFSPYHRVRLFCAFVASTRRPYTQNNRPRIQIRTDKETVNNVEEVFRACGRE